MMTPWGSAQSVERITPEIAFVSTAGHGGYYVTGAAQTAIINKFPAVLTSAASRYCPKSEVAGWYEEDCEWAAVALTFPQLFPARAAEVAAAMMERGDVAYLLGNVKGGRS